MDFVGPGIMLRGRFKRSIVRTLQRKSGVPDMDSNTGSRVAERGVKKKLALTELSGLPAEIEQNKEIQKSWAAVLAGAPFRHHDDIAR
jgi:hypothetical protein